MKEEFFKKRSAELASELSADRRYIHELRNTNLPFRGSEYQRIIIVDKYLKGESDYEWKLN